MAEPKEWQSMVELMGGRAEVELRDSRAKAELIAGKPLADPCSIAEPLEEPRG